MKFTVAKQDLEAALAIVTSAMSSTGNDLTSHYLFRVAGSGMEVLTHSGRIVALSPFIARVEDAQPGITMFTVEGWRLRAWLRPFKDCAFTFEYDSSSKKVSVEPQGQEELKGSRFESLDPTNWHFWDNALEVAKSIGKIPASRLHHALNHSRKFASDQENSSPELCVCEVKNSVLLSTDKAAATILRVQGLENSNMKVHIRDAGGIMSFLSLAGEAPVEIFEHPRTTFFKRQDGAVYGESRFTAPFPNFKFPSNDDDHVWVLDVDALKRGIQHLVALANKDDTRVIFRRPDPTGPVIMTMMINNESLASSFKLKVSDQVDGVVPIPADGFQLNHQRLSDLLDLQKTDTVRFGVNIRVGDDGEVKGGYVRFHAVEFADKDGNNGDEYTTILAFLKAN